VFGNFVNRIIHFTHQAFDGRVPSGGAPIDRELALAADIARSVAALRNNHQRLQFRRAAAETRAIWATANAYLQEAAPWALLKTSPEQAAMVTRTALKLCALSARLAWSIVPVLAERVLSAFAAQTTIPAWPENVEPILFDGRGVGGPVELLAPIVTKISDSDVARLEARFGGPVPE